MQSKLPAVAFALVLTLTLILSLSGQENTAPAAGQRGPVRAVVPVSAAQALPLAAPDPAPAPAKPIVQIAILLDTSGSMDGLIHQARTQLWAIVNQFALARQNGQRPDLQVALYQYGTPSVGDNEIRQISDFTSDLDKVSELLFALRTNGGDEYCGAVIQHAGANLTWNDSSKVYKAIFIAGNEPFSQGPVDYRMACKEAIAKGIIVNTIHCGDEQTGFNTGWKDGAMLTDGSFMTIDHNAAVVHFEAPQDKEIAELSSKLNETYVAYGAEGEKAAQRQKEQDANAAQASPSTELLRAVTKAGGNYQNSKWDLVDAVKDGKSIADIPAQELPEEMRKMSVEERKAYVEKMLVQREELQKKIKELDKQRQAHIAEQVKQQAQPGAKTLQDAVIDAVQSQAAKQGYEFKKEGEEQTP
ncbi:MAG: VWA domain-containing protein [Phycisphaeraceae bacterium]